MTEVAGRVADGLLCHSLTSAAYLRDVTIPVVREAHNRDLGGFTLSLPVLTALGADQAERERAEQAVRRQLAFYASTPAYRAVLDHHGWGELHERLNRLSRQQAWVDMTAAISDDVLDAFAVSGTPKQVAATVTARFAGLVDRIALYPPVPARPELVAEAVRLLREQQP